MEISLASGTYRIFVVNHKLILRKVVVSVCPEIITNAYNYTVGNPNISDLTLQPMLQRKDVIAIA